MDFKSSEKDELMRYLQMFDAGKLEDDANFPYDIIKVMVKILLANNTTVDGQAVEQPVEKA